MSVRRLSLFSFALLMFLFLFSIAVAAWSLLRNDQALDNINHEIRVVLSVIDPINHSRTMRVRLHEALNASHTGDQQAVETTLEAAREAMVKGDNAFELYMSHARQPDEQALAQAYDESWQNYRAQGLVPLLEAAQKGDVAGYNSLFSSCLPQLEHDFEFALNNLLAYREHYAKKLNDEAQGRINNGLAAIGLVALFFCSVLCVLFLQLNRRVLTPLNQAREHCDSIAAGELHMPIECHTQDEIGEMLQGLERMRQALTQIIGQVRATGEAVAAAVEDIADGNTDLSARTEQQAASLGQTAASMEELTATVRQTSENAHHASSLAEGMRVNASSGDDIMCEVVVSMKNIESSSAKINSIINIIENIAFQTNILALNAAVEAARAGEQGRGFAVVASEVRNLAQHSSVAAKEIKELIELSGEQIRSGSSQVNRAGESMERILASVKQVSGIMDEIAMPTREQSSGIDQINIAIGQMDSVTQQNASLVESASASTRLLSQKSHELRQCVAVFRLA
jgi:methyl-accepting chemotaxis protein-3 (ribose and galactose sensor receptor)